MYRGKSVYSLGTLEELSSGKEKAKSAMFREAKKKSIISWDRSRSCFVYASLLAVNENVKLRMNYIVVALEKFSSLSPNFTLKTKSPLNKHKQYFQVETHWSVMMKYSIYRQYNLVRENDMPS